MAGPVCYCERMGIHINLDIDPRGIDAVAWAAAHDDTLVLLEAWRPRLLGWGTRAIGAVELCVYARSIRVSSQASSFALGTCCDFLVGRGKGR